MKNCLNCQKETSNPKYCSKSCSAIQTNKIYPKRKTKKVCLVCQAPVSSFRKNRCDIHTEEFKKQTKESFKNFTIKEYINKLSLQNKHPSWKSSHIRLFARSWNKDLRKKSCVNCGYKLHVELAHIKDIASFPETATLGEVNDKNNLLPLCRNCHWEFDNDHISLNEILVRTEGFEPPFSTPITDNSLEG